MDPLGTLETLVNMGFDVKASTVKVVRNATDVKLVTVVIGNDFTGEGLVFVDALNAALDAQRRKVEKRHTQDTQLLTILPAPIA